MRYETNLSTGEVTEHGDAPATPEAPPTAHYAKHETGFKQTVAVTICDLMSELDPTGAHC